MMPGKTASGLLALLLAAGSAAHAQSAPPAVPSPCRVWTPKEPMRNPTEEELRCQYGMLGPGRFGLLSYLDVPVYQTATPMPGTHVVGVAGHARPLPGESYEQWEWRVLRTGYGPEVQRVHRELELLDPFVASRIMRFEAELRRAGIRFARVETWRSPDRQAYLFQQGRSRPGPLATTTLTSWHSQVDAQGRPAGRAVDYHVANRDLPSFHALARSVGLTTFGADSHDPGHVFLPDANIPAGEIVLLRVLPRVPVVTLGTGLPVDRSIPPGGLAAVRDAARQFASSPFLPTPTPSLARDPAHPAPVTRLTGGVVGGAQPSDRRASPEGSLPPRP